MYNTSLYSKPNTNWSIGNVSTRIGIFLGLDFTTNKTLEVNSNKYLSTIPSFSFSSDFTRVLIDYSNSQNETDKALLSGLFSGLTAGTTFTISDAIYSLDGRSSEANLGGTYSFDSFVNNVVVAIPVSLNNYNQRLMRYEPSYFINPPQFGLSLAPKSTSTEYVIVNALGTDKVSSFARFGIYPGDRVKITGTLYNNDTYTVKSIMINKDGSENMVVEEGLTLESGFGKRVGIELIQTGKLGTSIVAATGSVAIGACSIYKNGLKVDCFDNQSYDQCVVRTNYTGGSPFTWRPSIPCSQTPSNISTTVTGFAGTTETTNAFASLNSLGYFNSFNSVNL